MLKTLVAAVLTAQTSQTATQITFDLNAPRQQIRISGVDNLTAGDLTISNLTTTDTLAPEQLSIKIEAETRTATIEFKGFNDGVLPDGNYRVTLGEQRHEFSVLAGDLNADGIVDAQDFNILSGNFGNVAVQYRHGDLNYDGTIDSRDVNVFTAQNGKRLPSTQPATQPMTRPATQPTTQP